MSSAATNAERLYRYRAIRHDDGVVEGTISATDETAVANVLRARGLIVLKIVTSPENSLLKRRVRSAAKRKTFHLKAIIPHLGEWARLLKAGLTITEALRIDLAVASARRSNMLASQLLDDLRKGSTFQAAVMQSTKDVEPMVIAMIAAGERANGLAETLESLAAYYAASTVIRAKIRAAIAYPAFMITMALAVCLVLLTVVAPRIKEIAVEQHGQEAATHQLIFQLSDLLVNRSADVIGISLTLSASIVVLVRYRRRAMKRLLLRMAPPMRRFIEHLELARYFRALGTLVKAGLLVQDAARIMNQGWIAGELHRDGERVLELLNQGVPLNVALARVKQIPEEILTMVQLGEKSGQLGHMLLEIAHRFDYQIQSRLSTFVGLLGPALILLVGFIVGFIVLNIMNVFLSLSETVLK